MAAAALCLLASAAFAEVKVSMKAVPSQATVNNAMNIVITVEEGKFDTLPEPKLPSPLAIVGGPGEESSFNITPSGQSQTHRITWAISSSKEGVFTIPSFDVRAAGKSFPTGDLKVEFLAAPTGPKPEGPNRQNGRGQFDPILQMQVAKTEFYQGEIVPITAMLYVPASVALRRPGLIEVEKTDFAVQRFPQMGEQSQEMLGRFRYNTFTFRSTLSALKAGKTVVGPAKMEIIVDVPIGNSGLPFGFQEERRKVTVEAVEIPVNVLPLPAEGKPAGFSGAVGDFTLKATSNTHDVMVGDPVAVDLLVEGQGNFDALEAPKLTDASGWKLYSPRRYNVDNTDPNNADLMNRGVGFAEIIIPEKVMPAVPPFEFPFFNPRTKSYVTLRSSAIPLNIKPSDRVAPQPAGETAPSGPGVKQEAKPAPVAEIDDIVTRLPAVPRWAAASVPLFEDGRFRVFNMVLALALLGIVAAHFYKIWRRRRALSVDHDRHRLLREVESPGLSEAEFYRRAARFLHQYGGGKIPPAAKGLLEKYETLNFGGPSAGTGPVDPAARAEALAVLKQLKPAPGIPPPLPAALVLLFLLAGGAHAHAAQEVTPESRYQAGVQALEKKDYAGAQKVGEELVAEGHIGPEVFALVGNAFSKQDKPGQAAIWYQRALLFPRALPEVRQNLRYLGEKTHFFSFAAPPYFAWLANLGSRSQWAFMAVCGAWLMAFCMVILLLTAWTRQMWWWVVCIVAGVGAMFLGAGVWSLELWPETTPHSVTGLCLVVAGAASWLVGRWGLVIHLLTRARRPWPLAGLLLTGWLLSLAGTTGFRAWPAADDLAKRAFVNTSDAQVHTAAAEISGNVIALPGGSQVRRIEERGDWCYVEVPQPDENVFGWVLAKNLVPVWPFDVKKLP